MEFIQQDTYIYRIIGYEKWKQNAYIIVSRSTNEIVIVDPGGDNEEINEIVSSINKKVSYIVLTHGHHDHLAGARILAEKYNCDVFLHENDLKIYKQAPNFAYLIDKLKIELPENIKLLKGSKDVLPFSIGNLKWSLFAGHTPGSIILEIGNYLITGDLILKNKVGKSDLPGGDSAKLLESIKRLIETYPLETILLPGHGKEMELNEIKSWLDTKQNEDNQSTFILNKD